jgi:hypothetical protein
MLVFGELGHEKSPAPLPLDGKSVLAGWLYFDALRLSGPVVVLDKSEPTARYVLALDEMAGCERLDLSAYDGVIAPLRFGPAPSRSSSDTAGEW